MMGNFNYLLWILLGFCCVLVVVGIVLVAGRRRNGKRESFSGRAGSYLDEVHRMDDIPSGMESAREKKERTGNIVTGREANEKVGDVSSRIQDFRKQALDSGYGEDTEKATPVPPYTSWDEPVSPVSHSMISSRPEEEGKGGFSLLETPDIPDNKEKIGDVAQANAPENGPAKEPVFDLDERLLLLKSHELLLTLTDGLKKLSAAKTEAAKKEKIGEMMAALKLLDAKNEWDEYKNCFDKMNPEFWSRIESRSSEEMSPYELRLCALLSMGMGTKEIADLTNRSIRTVETTIYKIRKKLGMEAEDKTQDYLKKVLQEKK